MIRSIAAAVGILAVTTLAGFGQWTPVVVIDGDPVMRGLPRDAIPAVDQPVFVRAADARFLRPDEPVVGVTDGHVFKAYSTWLLNTHEIVNDTLGGRPIAVTWCPLCFTAIVYERQVGRSILTFGVSGMLWRENLVMYDRQTDSWWAQANGTAIRGTWSGAVLKAVPATMVSWREWSARHPDTLVWTTPAVRPGAGGDIYATYHRSRDLGVTGRLRSSGRPDAKSRILGFRLGGRAYAVSHRALSATPVVLSDEPGVGVVVVAARGGMGARVFQTGTHRFTVEALERRLTDVATGSTWDAVSGAAVAGPLKGTVLDEIPAHPAYWFAWKAFYPDTEWIIPP